MTCLVQNDHQNRGELLTDSSFRLTRALLEFMHTHHKKIRYVNINIATNAFALAEGSYALIL